VKFNPGAELFYADSNACAVNPRVEEGVTEVLLLDAHHDLGYTGKEYTFTQLQAMSKEGRWTCEDWAVFYFITGRPVQVWFPRWIDPSRWGEPGLRLGNLQIDPGGLIEGVDRVFVCRSGAWVPPWLDQAFNKFLVECPAAHQGKPGIDVQPDGMKTREWVDAEARGFAIAQRAVVDNFPGRREGEVGLSD
jgi:hypothetical protein